MRSKDSKKKGISRERIMNTKKRNIRKLTIIISVFILLFIPFFSVNAKGNVAEIFSDVREDAWYVKFVQYVYDNGIMAGNSDGTFGPDKPLLREQFTQVLYNMSGKPASSNSSALPFTDVKSATGYPADAIRWAYENGIAGGNANNTFGVGSKIQRQAVAVMLYKYASANGFDMSLDENVLSGFSDTSKIEGWALTPVKWAVSQGIISGKGNRLDPSGAATRAECATMIMKVLEKNSNTHEHVFEQKKTSEKYLKSAATCTKPAVYYYSCKCGEYTKNETFKSGQALGHSWDQGTVMKEATEEEEGVKNYHCTRTGCSATKTETIPKTAHTHSYAIKATDGKFLKSAATCTKPAVYYYSCKCGEYTTTRTFENGQALGHSWDQGTVTKEATEEEEGVKTYHCTRTGCNATKTETIPKIAHTHYYTIKATDNKFLKSAATCTKPAVYYYSCKCGEYTKTRTFESGQALGHSWDQGTVTKNATEEEEGVITFRCTRQGCSASRTESIPKVEINPIMDWHSVLDFPEPVPQEENPENRMSHNIYSDLNLANTSGKYSGFLVDFCADHAPNGTSWILADFKMDVSGLSSVYNVTDEGRVTAGFANWYGKKVSLTFDDISYLDDNNQEVTVSAKQLYPGGNDEIDYPWIAGKWYRLYLYSYEDTQTGHTFVEEWIQNIESGIWTKVFCYDTGLMDSCITGGISQFMYNSSYAFCNETRTFGLRNMYVREYDSGEWSTIHQSNFSVDTWWDDKKGNFAYTSDGNTFYGITCGYGPDAATIGDDISGILKVDPLVGPTYVRVSDGVATTVTEEIPDETITQLMDWHSILDYPDPVPQEDNPEQRMAHYISSYPVKDGTSRKYSGFLIDFCSDSAPVGTYWSLCSWEMDTSDFEQKYTIIDSENSAGAYAGLQCRPDGKKAIMSFWEIKYLDENNQEQSLRAKRIYPEGGETNNFGGEGEGTNYIGNYYWKTGKWYRMYICCYDDAATGHTFVEQWVMDIESGVWTKISCFDTLLSHSYIKGGMGQFLENYLWEYCNETRTFAYRNIYVREYDTGEWKPLNETDIYNEAYFNHQKGNFAYTSDANTFYIITCGYGPDAAAPGEEYKKRFRISSTAGPTTP